MRPSRLAFDTPFAGARTLLIGAQILEVDVQTLWVAVRIPWPDALAPLMSAPVLSAELGTLLVETQMGSPGARVRWTAVEIRSHVFDIGRDSGLRPTGFATRLNWCDRAFRRRRRIGLLLLRHWPSSTSATAAAATRAAATPRRLGRSRSIWRFSSGFRCFVKSHVYFKVP